MLNMGVCITLLAYNRISRPNLVPYLQHMLCMFGENGIAIFRRLLANGFRVNHVTFLSALSSCVHGGSVEIDELFDLMQQHDVKLTIKLPA